MENKLEQLLNTLIQRGWKPRNVISKNIYIYKVKDKINLSYSEFLEDEWEVMHEDEWYSLRDLVSKSSWLWQFVCENGMINVDETEVYYFWLKRKWTLDRGHYYLSEAGEDTRTNNYEYRLIETALTDEDKLEQFLLNSIKLE